MQTHKNGNSAKGFNIVEFKKLSEELTFHQLWLNYQRDILDKDIYNIFFHIEENLSNYADTQDITHILPITDFLTSFHNAGRIDTLINGLRKYASDCFILIGNYNLALRYFPPPQLGDSINSYATDRYLTLKQLTKTKVEAKDLLSLVKPKVTRFGEEYLPQIADYIEKVYLTKDGGNLLTTWVQYCDVGEYFLFIGNMLTYWISKNLKIKEIKYSKNKEFLKFIYDATRSAENAIRDEMGFPKIGEGWISETKLYYEIKAALSGYDVIQHARPIWLGQQHLDIFIPSLMIAIEYQGLQHDQAVDYFGGIENYLLTIKRDQRKQRLCKKHGVKLIYVREGYQLNNIIHELSMSNTQT